MKLATYLAFFIYLIDIYYLLIAESEVKTLDSRFAVPSTSLVVLAILLETRCLKPNQIYGECGCPMSCQNNTAVSNLNF